MAGQIFTHYKVGLQNVGSYQASGKPFASGSIDASNALSIAFPAVTRWVQVINNDDKACRVGFSTDGVTHHGGTNFFTVAASGSSHPLELKLSQISLSGSNNVDVVAGLTGIAVESINNPSVSPSAPYINWSGSSGVG